MDLIKKNFKVALGLITFSLGIAFGVLLEQSDDLELIKSVAITFLVFSLFTLFSFALNYKNVMMKDFKNEIAIYLILIIFTFFAACKALHEIETNKSISDLVVYLGDIGIAISAVGLCTTFAMLFVK